MTNSVISSADLEILASEAGIAASSGQLSPAQLEVLYRHRLFKLFVPKSLGGLALSLPEALRIQERLAYADGSVGWTTTLCAGASWFVGFLNPVLSKSLFANSRVCFGGSGMDSGTATRQSDGTYLINGFWQYATGAPHLSVITANCRLLEKDGNPRCDPQGNPLVRSFCFMRDEVELIEAWNTMGLQATASHSFRIVDLQIGAERMFQISPEQAVRQESIYKFPFVQFAELTLASNYLGMCRRFMDLCADPGEFCRSHTAELVKIADRSWDQLDSEGKLDPALLEEISTTCRASVHQGFRQVQACYPSTGIRGATMDTELNRVWRDIFTASQHVIFR